MLVAAAWLHDVGYAAPLGRSGFHPPDGAWHLQEHSWPELLAGLVAHHSAACLVAAARGLADQMQSFPAARYACGPLADALTYADQTTGPDGRGMATDGGWPSRTGWPRCCAGTARTAPTPGGTRSGRRPSAPRYSAPPQRLHVSR